MQKKRLCRRTFCALLMIVSLFSLPLSGCSSQQGKQAEVVTFYGWGGDDQFNAWFDQQAIPQAKEQYGITLTRVSMDIDQILTKLSAEKQANKSDGTIDIIWINGENFASAKQNDLLYGAFADQIENFTQYIMVNDPDAVFDFGVPTDGYEVPFGKSQFVLAYDQAKTANPPKNAEELLSFAKQHPGQVTYPAPPDFTGSAFVRTVLYDLVGYEALRNCPPEKDQMKALLEPALDYFRTLNPYLWNDGKTFPATVGQVHNMFADGELLLTMDYNPHHVALQIEKGRYPDTVNSFLFEQGTVSNAHYLSIAHHAPNPEGAKVIINQLLSPALQLSKFEKAKHLPSLDLSLLSVDDRALFEEVALGTGVLSAAELAEKRLPELPSTLIPLIEEIWLEEVAGA